MAKYIKADGTITTVAPGNGTSFTLEELQGMVGGYIEMVRCAHGLIMMVNEEGKLHGLPVNPVASCWNQPHDVIVGDVVVGTWAEMGGGGEGEE